MVAASRAFARPSQATEPHLRTEATTHAVLTRGGEQRDGPGGAVPETAAATARAFLLRAGGLRPLAPRS